MQTIVTIVLSMQTILILVLNMQIVHCLLRLGCTFSKPLISLDLDEVHLYCFQG